LFCALFPDGAPLACEMADVDEAPDEDGAADEDAPFSLAKSEFGPSVP
jgi:hypothetical protein